MEVNIRADRIEVELSNQEARDLAYHIKHSLESSIDSHYVQTFHDSYSRGLDGHAKPLFEEQCRKDLNMMNRLMACAEGSNNNWLENELWRYLEDKYNEKNPPKKK